jgi:hypothetical protein
MAMSRGFTLALLFAFAVLAVLVAGAAAQPALKDLPAPVNATVGSLVPPLSCPPTSPVRPSFLLLTPATRTTKLLKRSRAEVMACAKDWAARKVPYCQCK